MSATPATTEAQSFGERLLLLRRRAGLGQKELGAQVGLSKSAISKLELGHRRADETLIRALCEVLGTTPNDLLGFSSDRLMPSSLSRAA